MSLVRKTIKGNKKQMSIGTGKKNPTTIFLLRQDILALMEGTRTRKEANWKKGRKGITAANIKEGGRRKTVFVGRKKKERGDDDEEAALMSP